MKQSIIYTEESRTRALVSMHGKGASLPQIASETGITVAAVQYRLQALACVGTIELTRRRRSFRKKGRL